MEAKTDIALLFRLLRQVACDSDMLQCELVDSSSGCMFTENRCDVDATTSPRLTAVTFLWNLTVTFEVAEFLLENSVMTLMRLILLQLYSRVSSIPQNSNLNYFSSFEDGLLEALFGLLSNISGQMIDDHLDNESKPSHDIELESSSLRIKKIWETSLADTSHEVFIIIDERLISFQTFL